MYKNFFKNILLVCDMDGTLLNSNCKLSDRNINAIKYFIDNGGLFTIATGRMESSAIKNLPKIPMNTPGIFYNGASIYDFQQKKVLWKNCLSKEVETIIEELIKRYKDMAIQILSDGNIYTINPNSRTELQRKREGFTPIEIDICQIPRPWYKVLLVWENRSLQGVKEFLSGKSENFRTVFSDPQLLDILGGNVSKGNALKKLTEMLNNDELFVVAVGDNLNDLEMIGEADLGIAVENAHDDLKKAADFCCCHHDNGIIEDVIEIIKSVKKI